MRARSRTHDRHAVNLYQSLELIFRKEENLSQIAPPKSVKGRLSIVHQRKISDVTVVTRQGFSQELHDALRQVLSHESMMT